jgi:hypothetical protein
VGRQLALLLVGLGVGVVGTGIHRYSAPWGLLLAVATVVSAGVLARAWTGWVGMLVVALGVFSAVAVLAGRGPGGDVLVARDLLGILWYAGAAAVAVSAVLPRSWFRDREIGRAARG